MFVLDLMFKMERVQTAVCHGTQHIVTDHMWCFSC